MIQSVNDRKQGSILNASLFESKDNNTFKLSTVKKAEDDLQESAEDIYNALIRLNSSTDLSRQEINQKTRILKMKLAELKRYDLIDLYDSFIGVVNKREESVDIKRDIQDIIDITKINPEIIPYLVSVEQRLQRLEEKMSRL